MEPACRQAGSPLATKLLETHYEYSRYHSLFIDAFGSNSSNIPPRSKISIYLIGIWIFHLAEEVGFEPTEGVNPQRFSRPSPSTTQPLLHIYSIFTTLCLPGGVSSIKHCYRQINRYALEPIGSTQPLLHIILIYCKNFVFITPGPRLVKSSL